MGNLQNLRVLWVAMSLIILCCSTHTNPWWNSKDPPGKLQATPLHKNRRGLYAERQPAMLTVIFPPFTTLTQSLSLRHSSNSWRSPLQGRGL